MEINYTFYRLPNAKTIAGWVAATPDELLVRAEGARSGSPTSSVSGRWTSPSATSATPRRLLAGKLGPLLFQLPPNFKKDTERLGGLLDLLPSDLRVAFEFRHPTWFDEEVYELLRAAERRALHRRSRRRRDPAVATADWGYLRLRAVRYSAEALARWAGTIHELFGAGGRPRLLQARGWRDGPAAGPEAAGELLDR